MFKSFDVYTNFLDKTKIKEQIFEQKEFNSKDNKANLSAQKPKTINMLDYETKE